MKHKPRQKGGIVKTLISMKRCIRFQHVYSSESNVMFIQQLHSAQQVKHLLTIA